MTWKAAAALSYVSRLICLIFTRQVDPGRKVLSTLGGNMARRLLCVCLHVSPGRRYETFPVDTERLWHHWLHHLTERQKETAQSKWDRRNTKTSDQRRGSVTLELVCLISYSLFQKDLYVFPKATGIIVPYSFGISKGFQKRSCLEYLPGIQTHSKSTSFVNWVTNMLKMSWPDSISWSKANTVIVFSILLSTK